MGQLISRFDKNKLLQPDDLITSGIACQLLYTHPKTLNDLVDSGIIPAVKAQQRTRWDGDSGKWRVFKVSHLLAHAVLRKQPVDETMLKKQDNPIQMIDKKFNKVFCYGYDYSQVLPNYFQLTSMRGIYRILELCPIVPILIGPEIELGRALGLAEELLFDFDPLDISVWRQMDPYGNEDNNVNDFDMSVFKETFANLASACEFFLTKRGSENANA